MTDMPFDEFVASLPTKRPRASKPRTVRGKVQRKPSATAHLRQGPSPAMEWMEGDPCSYCGQPSSQWDHIEPLYRGGSHSAANLTRACWSCNKAKNTQKLVVFLARRGIVSDRPRHQGGTA